MNNCVELPEGYSPLLQIDLQKNKKLAVLVNLLALLIGAIMLLAGFLLVPQARLLDYSEEAIPLTLLRLAVLLVGMVAYILLHELVHGVCMKAYSGVSAHYGFTGLYAYAGSRAYFNRKSYIVIALAPVVIWGVVLAVASILVPLAWFWVVYIIQILNISGAAGDLYVTWKMFRLPAGILIQDSGTAMMVYAPAQT